jgi:hypothetical protein
MVGSANSMTRGTEISERSTELVLPGITSTEKRVPLRGREIGVNGSEASSQRASETGRAPERERAPAGEAHASADRSAPSNVNSSAGAGTTAARGVALPGDRSSRSHDRNRDRGHERSHDTQEQRPSFWRRIALGRRSQPEPTVDPLATTQGTVTVHTSGSSSVPAPSSIPTAASIEMRIVEPMLQALVSVESKLERSHLDLMGRSDQVEQRLTQLWDIEEQLGALGEIQESLLTVTEQQRRLERTIESQNRTLRWMVAAIFFSLAAAAFVVAAVLR